ncbi:MAG: right-handed parallel beta-helix repeat-containing protein [FCB group bacterium]|nr:right-handed parallel beta-helix repeat-containing protein [FCB group bacterium]
MRSKITFAALGLAAFLLLASPAALAQSDVFVAAKPPMDASYVAQGYDVSSTIQEAVNKAMSSASAIYAAYSNYAVYVDWNLGAPWVESVHIYADADITIQGVTSPIGGQKALPQDVIIQSSSFALPVMEIIPAQDSSKPVNNLVVEGLTLTAGSVGFHAKAGGEPTLNRVYVYGNTGSGVLCEDDSRALLVNCSIVQNTGHGVEVASNSFVRTVFCTIYDNSQSGVHGESSVAGTSGAQVENTIVFQNSQSGIEWTAAAAPLLTSNDVYDNGPTGTDNYINVPDPGDLSVDPILWTDSPPWVGALLTSQCIYGIYGIYDVYNGTTSPVIDVAASIDIPPFTAEDFEAQERPVAYLAADKLPDIGADEVVLCGYNAGLPVWWRCEISPNPVGKLDVGDLKIEIGLTRAATVDPILYMVPQGGSEFVPEDWITFTQTNSNGLGAYTFENFVAIDPTLTHYDAVGNVIDGHAIVYLRVDDITYGINDSGLIQGQAITGRHTIIDTTPPRLAVEADGLQADELVFVLNSAVGLTANEGAVSAFHPALPSFLDPLWLPADTAFPVMVPGPAADDGLILQNVFAGQGSQIFINVGSRSNNIVAENLDLSVVLPFEDLPPLFDPLDLNSPRLTGRVVSGFSPSITDPEITNGPSNSIATWDFVVNSGLFTAAEAHCVYTTSGDNFGFDPAAPGGPDDVSYNYNNSSTEAEWTFVDENGNPTLEWTGSTRHDVIRFRARDRAGNVTETNMRLEPLHTWWIVDARSRFNAPSEGSTVDSVNFTVQMDRSPAQSPAVTPALQPQFTYRFYTSPNYDGPYVPSVDLPNWAAWTSNPSIMQPYDFGGDWVLLVTLAADEAGNVEQWPDTINNIDDPILFNAGSALNWRRFRVTPSGAGNLDTILTPYFWHDGLVPGGLPPQGEVDAGETVFGGQPIIPSPPNIDTACVGGRFTIAVQTTTMYRIGIVYSLAGGEVASSSVDQLLPLNATTLEIIVPTPRLEDITAPRMPQNWVFSAQAYIDVDDNGLYEPNGDDVIDQTPASFAFTVVPQTSLDAYVRNRESMDRQPIKVQEER